MAQHDYNIANGTGAAVRSDLNNALAAIVSNNSGATEPATMYAYQWWADTSTGLLKLRNAANNAWITLRELDGTLTIEAGTVSAPGLAFASDLNTGIYSPGADQVAITTNGVERVEWGTSEVVFNDGGANYDFRIEGDTNSSLFFVDASAEAVGIGTTAPTANLELGAVASANQSLRINSSGNNYLELSTAGATGEHKITGGNSASGTAQLIFETASGGTESERARIDSSGRLLVGTSSARQQGYGDNSSLQVEGTSYPAGSIGLVVNTNDATGPSLNLAKTRGTAVGSNTVVQNNDLLGLIAFSGADGTDTRTIGARIQANVDGTPGADDLPSRLTLFVTLDGAASPTEALRITNDRVVAYNQAAPAAVNATATLTVANLKTGIITSTSAAATDMTLPTGTDTQAGFSDTYNNMTFEWSVINTGPSLVTVLASTAHTLVGSGAVATGTSARFASRRSSANTFVTYRLS
jgi:hypothetical protein